MTTAFVGVGSNIRREYHARFAVNALSSLGHNIVISTIYDCASVDFDSNPFFNFVVQIDTEMSLQDFCRALRDIEFESGREINAKKYQDRALDLDVILFGDTVSVSSPQLPREDIFKYPFVIQPLYDLSPECVIPEDGRTVKEIWLGMDNLASLTPVDLQFGGY